MSHTVSSKMQPGVLVTIDDAEYERWLQLGIVYEGLPVPVTTSPLDTQIAELVDRVESATRAELRALMGADAGGLNDGVVSTLVTGPSTTADALRAAFGTVSVSAFGAVGSGVVDDSAALQAAHNALPAAGGIILVPPGYKCRAEGLHFDRPITLRGSGMGSHVAGTTGRNMATYDPSSAPSAIFTTSATEVIIDSTAPLVIEDIAIVGTHVSPTSSLGVRVQNGDGLRLNRVRFANLFDLLDIQQSEYAGITNCLFIDAVRYGVRARNLFHPDQGDMYVAGTTFGMSGAYDRNPDAGFLLESGGGLKWANNKVNMGWGGVGKYQRGLDVQLADGVETVDLLVNGSSFENVTESCIRLGRAGTTGNLYNVVVVGNQFSALGANGIDGYDGVQTGVIADNVFTGVDYSIYFHGGGGWRVGHNLHRGLGGTAVVIGSGSYGHVEVAPQTFDQTVGSIVVDQTTSAAVAAVDYDYTAPITAPIGATVETMYKFGTGLYNAQQVDLHLAGSIVGVGAYSMTLRRRITREAGGPTVSTPTGWTDDTYGGALPVVTFAVVGGEIQVNVASPNGNQVYGVLNIKLRGQVTSFNRGA